MTDHEALEALSKKAQEPGALLADKGAFLIALETAYHTGQLILVDDAAVERVALDAIFPILWREQCFNGINIRDSVDPYRMGGSHDMGGVVEGYEVKAREIAQAAIAAMGVKP